MTRVKICGLMNQRDASLCVQAGVHMLGFVVDYPTPVPWNLTRDAAKELIGQVPPFVSTCIVTGGNAEHVIETALETTPNVVQLHYKETLNDIRKIAGTLKSHGIKTMKALRISKEGKCDFEIIDPALAARELCKTGISAIIVDSYTEAMPGGTGVMVDLETFQKIQQESTLPVVLAGGLNPANIAPLVQQVNPFAVDVLTGVEVKPGQKAPEKITAFINKIHRSEQAKRS
ncbi:phosphoribosylanthranilate isomerase [Bacillus benzoevorans]|uniref:N-(5'-phosphoribosyl)anthranilate isomerase n=1 Tax=Bacillus benzoevorans TaxID=1456 RepID=A0A7X0HQ92_9BACI|nr:phosphoribosylanthranilate isomerase [Bacillus benzoevorans]